MKTGPGFKLSKSTKRVLATMTGDMYGVYKRMMIDAEVAETKAKQAKLTKNVSKSETKVS